MAGIAMVLRYSAFGQVLAVLPLIGAGMLSVASPAIGHAQVSRIGGQPDNAATLSVSGQVHPWARAQFDRGPVPSNTNGRMLLMLKRSSDKEAALQSLLADQQNPQSPNYEKWLTPDQFGQQFGVADSDVQAISGYLASRGMTVGRLYKNRMAIEVGATADQIRSTFKTEIHSYAVGGQTFYANATAPQIPAEMSRVVSGFASLNNFRVNSTPVAAKQGILDSGTHTVQPLYSSSGNSPYGVAPADLAKIYAIPGATGTGKGGANVNIGVVGDSNINVAYINKYRSIFGLSVNPPTVITDGNDPGIGNLNGVVSNPNKGTSNNDEYIAYKQIELLSAVAPNANIFYYTSATTDYDTGLDFALVRAVEDNRVQVLLNGFQTCESTLGASMVVLNQMAEQASAQGITMVVAAGNSGAAGCEVPGTAGQSATGYAVNGYASSPFVTAVGGTDFNYGASSASTYWSGANGSATAYIPEQAWNDSNVASSSNSFELAGGGGVSASQAIPSYQQSNAAVTAISTKNRVIPDVSFFAGSGVNDTMGYNQAAYLFCMLPSDCSGSSQSSATFTYSGGTEASSAVFAGAVALAVNAKNGGSAYGLGNINPTLYALVASKKITANDVTVGSNALACSSNAPNCSNNVMTGYSAGTGYDAATGLGSLDISTFVSNYLPSYAIGNPASVALTVTDSSTNLPVVFCSGSTTTHCTNHSNGLILNVAVTPKLGSTTIPTGDVVVLTTSPVASNGVAESLVLANGTGVNTGTAVASDNYNLLPGGTYKIFARYAGDANYAPAVSSSYNITVAPESCGIVIYNHNISQTSTNMPYGSPVTITAEPYSLAYTGAVAAATGSLQVVDTFGSSTNTITTLPLNSSGSATFISNLLAFGQHSIVLNYLGDTSFNGCSSSPFLVNITKASTTTTLLAPENDPGGSTTGTLGVTAIVQSSATASNGTPSNGSAPTGTVTFNTTNPQTLTLVPGFDLNGNAIATVSTTISKTDIPSSGQFTATYNPAGTEVNYTGSTSAAATFQPTVAYVNDDTTTTFTIVDNSGSFSAPGSTTPSYPARDSMTLNLKVVANNPSATVFLVYANGVQLSPPIIKDSNGFVIGGGLPIDSNGNATLTIPQQNGYLALPSGQVQLSVIYDGWYQPGTGNGTCRTCQKSHQSNPSSANQIINIVDDRTSADFSLQSDTTVNTTNLVSPTIQAAFNLRLTSIYNFQSAYNTTAINLSCKVTAYSDVNGVRGNPAGLACGFDSALSSTTKSVQFSNATTAGFLTAPFYVGAASGSCIAVNNNAPLPTAPASSPWWFATGGTTLACIFLLGIPARRRNWQSTLGACVLAIIGFGMTGCGATVSSGKYQDYYKSLNGGTAGANCAGTTVPSGLYTVSVTGTTTTNTTLTHTIPLQVKVGNF